MTDFFSKLRRLKGIEKEVEQLKRDILDQERRHEQHEDTPEDASACLFLKNIEEDLCRMKVGAQRAKSSLANDGGFMAALPLCEALVKKLDTNMTNVETYLAQYAYVPLVIEANKENVQLSGENNVTNTPKPDSVETKPKLDHTPKLEDFGLSDKYLMSIRNETSTILKESPKPMNITMKTLNSSAGTMSPCDQNTPDSFSDSMEIKVTPGVFDGRSADSPAMSDRMTNLSIHNQSDAIFESPFMPHPRKILLSSLMFDNESISSAQEDTGDIETSMSSKFKWKRSQKPQRLKPKLGTRVDATDKPSPLMPNFSLPGMNRLCQLPQDRPAVSSSESSLANTPDFRTAGLNKTLNDMSVINPVLEKYNSTDTPETPEYLTRNINTHLLRELNKPAVTTHGSAVATTMTPDLNTPELHTTMMDDDDTPPTPELTLFDFKTGKLRP